MAKKRKPAKQPPAEEPSVRQVHPSMALRTCSAEDADWIYELNKTNMREYVQRTWNKDWIDADERPHFDKDFDPTQYIIVLIVEEPIGYLCYQCESTRVFLKNIQIKQEWRKEGIGAALVTSLLATSRQNALPTELLVLKVNPARQLYERLGFAVVEEQEHFYLMRAP